MHEVERVWSCVAVPCTICEASPCADGCPCNIAPAAAEPSGDDCADGVLCALVDAPEAERARRALDRAGFLSARAFKPTDSGGRIALLLTEAGAAALTRGGAEGARTPPLGVRVEEVRRLPLWRARAAAAATFTTGCTGVRSPPSRRTASRPRRRLLTISPVMSLIMRLIMDPRSYEPGS